MSDESAPQGPRNLGGFLECLVGERVSVECKSDLVVSGILDSIDGKMNVFLGDATQYWMEGRWRGHSGPKMEYVFLASRTIRYIHLPDELDLNAQLHLMQERKRLSKYKRHLIT